jgi:hypothetical protein
VVDIPSATACGAAWASLASGRGGWATAAEGAGDEQAAPDRGDIVEALRLDREAHQLDPDDALAERLDLHRHLV